MSTDADDSLALRVERLEMTVVHQQELAMLRENALSNHLDELKAAITAIRALIMRVMFWGAGGLLAAVCSLIWQRLLN